jgi:hypothetical protein
MNHLAAARNALRMLPAAAAVTVFGFMAPAHSAEAASITQEAAGPLQQNAAGSIQQPAAGSLQATAGDDDKFVWVCMTVRGVRVCFPVLK